MRGYNEIGSEEVTSVVLRLAQPDGTYVKTDVAAYVRDPANSLYPVLLGVAREYRFSGQVGPNVYYSGAHHSLFVASIVNLVLRGNAAAILGGLIHDLPEAFVRDLPTPVKSFVRQEGEYAYDTLHNIIDRAFCERLGLLLSPEDLTMVAAADKLALRAEQAVFQGVKFTDTTEEDRLTLQVLDMVGSNVQEILTVGAQSGRSSHTTMVDFLEATLDTAVLQYQESMPLN